MRTERRDDREQEFPRINESLTGARHRYGYTVGTENTFGGASPGPRSTSRTTRRVRRPSRRWTAGFVGEVSFVPNPGSRAEDDGVLMGFGHDLDADEGQLLILDAQSLETVARVHLPQRVPMGFHGNWCPAESQP